MKVGDLIYDSHFEEHGIVVDTEPMFDENGDWCSILYEDGKLVGGIRSWEETVEVISESLTDEQLEDVRGGMSYQTFSDWRARKINEGR